MKKTLSMLVFATLLSANVSAQSSIKNWSVTNYNEWTLNSRVWCTNYFTTLIYALAESSIKRYAADDRMTVEIDGKKVKTSFSREQEQLFDRILPDPDLVFPIGLEKGGFDNQDIYGPYHRAFSNPIKHIGDYAVGVDASYKPGYLGAYAGAYFKSQEICFKDNDDNLRGYYFQPRVGIVMGGYRQSFEAGVFYDVVAGCGGTVEDTNKDRIKGGLGLDFSFASNHKYSKSLIQFSMPLHNFLNSSYNGQAGMKRKVGYIMLTHRVFL